MATTRHKGGLTQTMVGNGGKFLAILQSFLPFNNNNGTILVKNDTKSANMSDGIKPGGNM